ncbi:MAG: inositol monophosphatase, partial [Alphaproteobacteria bacterium]|nr:inositol monophosphatase [Alphaproteobacteria bacterium]
MTDIDTKKVEEIIRRVAAETVMPRFNNLLASEIREKGPGDFVTIADEESEKTFSALLPALLPGSLVVGEEAVAKDKSVVEKMKGDKPVWVIDPVDGTYNFSHGSRKFGILVSLVQNGETLYGWAFDAPGNRMAVAARGAGTFLDGKRVNISCAAGETGELTGRGSGFRAGMPFRELVNQRCSLHDYMDFITGDADFVVHMPKVTPWDH